MMKAISHLLFLFLTFNSCRPIPGTQGTPEPLGENELMALVGGGVLPENLVAEIRDRGVAFHPDDYFGSQLRNAGADPAAAEAAYERELKVTAELDGAQSANMAGPFQSLGRNALIQRDYASAEKFFFRAVDVNEKVFGEGSDKVAYSLLDASSVYVAQKDYAKAETYLLRALNTEESLHGREGVDLLMPLANVCALYDKWGKPDKLEPYNRQMIAVLEKQFGANSPQLVSTLTSEAHTLRSLGRPKEATDVENRLASIRSATMNPH